MKPHSFHREAQSEYEAAAQHYRSISRQLGERFEQYVNGLVDEVCETPATFQRFDPPYQRHFRVRRFPYQVVYLDLPERVVVLAVRAFKQRPGVWRGKFPGPLGNGGETS